MFDNETLVILGENPMFAYMLGQIIISNKFMAIIIVSNDDKLIFALNELNGKYIKVVRDKTDVEYYHVIVIRDNENIYLCDCPDSLIIGNINTNEMFFNYHSIIDYDLECTKEYNYLSDDEKKELKMC